MSDNTTIKAKVRVDKLIYPRYAGQQNAGEWGIVACSVVEEIEGKLPVNKYNNVTIKAQHLPKIQLDEEYLVVGNVIDDEKWGGQVNALFFSMVFNFDDEKESNTFLKMVFTESQYNMLIDHFDNPVQLFIDKNVEALTKINGIGVKTAIKLIEKFEEVQDFSHAYIVLGNLGLSQTWIVKLLETYGSPDVIVDVIKDNPYMLIENVDGIGWSKADEIALNNGFTMVDKRRLKAFVLYYLKEEAEKGHSWTAPWDIIDMMNDKCGETEFELRTEVFTELREEDKIWFNEDKTMVALASVKRLEWAIKEELERLIQAESEFEYDNFESILKTQELKQNWEFTEEQIEAIKGTLESNVTIITGNAGTGKSSVVSAVINILHEYSFAQTALAGRAADRLREITGEDGYTIHRLLGYTAGSFTYNRSNPLPINIIILDETSMVGGILFLSLISAIPSGEKIIMLGDEGQLEAIGMLNIFADMMNSGIVTTYKLTKIHRQAEKSAIITESIKIKNQQQIASKTELGVQTRGELQDLVLDLYDEKEYTKLRIMHHFIEELNRLKDISLLQVIVPMRTSGESSVLSLNREIQKYYNGTNSFSVTIGSPKFPETCYEIRENDKVIIRRNNYKDVFNPDGKQVAVFNGNIGIVKEIDYSVNTISIELNTGETVIMPKKTWKSIELAYAITCHSFQGSSANTVIIGLDFSSYTMLTKEWIYTAMTRAEKHCVLCAQNSALRYAINTTNVPHKRTFLTGMLRGEKYE